MFFRAVTFARLAILFLSAAAASCGSSPTGPQPPPAACTYLVSSQVALFTAGGGNGHISVSAGSSCPWSVRAEHPWVTFPNGPTATGTALVTFAVAANTGAAVRETTLSVDGVAGAPHLRVVQEAAAPVPACSYTASTTSHRFGTAGGKATLAIGAGTGCAWQATSSEPWLTFEGPAQGSGDGSVVFVVAPWTGTAERTAGMRVGGREVTIWQDPPAPAGCEYSVSPTAFTMHWHDTQQVIQVTTNDGCAWTVEPGASWMSISGGSGRSGPGAITFSVPTYTAENTRSAPVMIRWPSASQGQNVWVTHEGCRYGFGYASRSFTSAGGRDHVTVLRDPVSTGCAQGCPVTPEVNVPWIQVTSLSLGIVSDMDLFYEVLANTTGADRTGTIKVGDRTLTITQAR